MSGPILRAGRMPALDWEALDRCPAHRATPAQPQAGSKSTSARRARPQSLDDAGPVLTPEPAPTGPPSLRHLCIQYLSPYAADLAQLPQESLDWLPQDLKLAMVAVARCAAPFPPRLCLLRSVSWHTCAAVAASQCDSHAGDAAQGAGACYLYHTGEAAALAAARGAPCRPDPGPS